MYRVFVNCRITRRKTFHLIMNEDGTVAARFAHMSHVLDWLAWEDQTEYMLVSERYCWEVQVKRSRNVEERETWQKLQPPY
jgi:hypothetical protein